MTLAVSELLILGGCSLLQSAIGFAFSLFAVPLMLIFSDLPLPRVVTLVILASTLQRLLLLKELHSHIAWRRLVPVIVASLLMMPGGIWLMHQMASGERAAVRRVIGVVILTTLLMRWRRQPELRDKLATRWGVLAGGLSGLMQGLANIGGPPLVLWLHAQRLTNEALRATISGISLPQVPVQLGLMLATFGTAILPSWRELPFLALAVGLGHVLGTALGGRIPEPQLRLIATVLLVLICISAMFGG